MDDRLRELRRRYQETGDPSDGARLLRGALRSGALDPEQAALAAYVGHTAAQAALELPALVPPPGPWLRGLERWGTARVVEAAILCGRLALSEANRRLPSDDLPSRWRAIESAEAWLTCPCVPHAHEARVSATFTPDARPVNEPYVAERLGAWTHAALAAAGGWPGQTPADHAGAAAEYVAAHVGLAALHAAVRDAFAGPALGELA